MKKLRIIAIFLLITVLLSTFVGCSIKYSDEIQKEPSDTPEIGQENTGEAPGNGNETENGEAPGNGNETENGEASGNKPDIVIGDKNLTHKDWDGRAFKVLSQKGGESSGMNIIDLVGDAEGDTVSKAAYERNRFIQDTFNVKIDQKEKADYYSIIGDVFLSDIGEYDAVKISITSALRKCQCYVELNFETEYINLSESWWDQSLLADTAVEGKNYFALGDISTSDELGTACIIFDRSLADNTEGISTAEIYEAVNNGEWTLECMKLMSAKLENDPNAKGNTLAALEPSDPYKYGAVIVNQEFASQYFIDSSGAKSYEYDSEKKRWNTNYMEDGFENVLYEIGEKLLFSSFSAHNSHFLAAGSLFYDGNIVVDKIYPSIGADKILFYIGSVYELTRIKNYSDDLGILPLPKVTETQEVYVGALHNGVYCYAISVKAEDYDFSGFMLEALCYYSSPEHFGDSSLHSAYRKSLLQTVGDSETDMMNLIFGNRRLDIGFNLSFNKFRYNISEFMTTGSVSSWQATIALDSLRMDIEFDDWTQGIYD